MKTNQNNTAIITVPKTNTRVSLELIRDKDGTYRWYENGNIDTEVSGNNVLQATRLAQTVWRDWSIRINPDITG